MKLKILIMIIGLLLITGCGNDSKYMPENTVTGNVVSEKTVVDIDAKYGDEDVGDTKGAKKFNIYAEDYKFTMDGVDNPDIRVKKGDTVIIELISTQRSHNWNVAEIPARSKTVITDESTTLEFVAHTAGTFEYYCSVGSHKHQGQKGTFIVE